MTLPQTMKDKVILITGATRGIGYETALALAGMGATMVMVGRDAQRTADCASRVKTETGNPNIDFLLADLSSLEQTRQLAHEFLKRYDRLHVLINNAGALFMKRQESVDGFEMTFALNHLSPFLLTHLLLDVMRASAPARIINVSSAAHRFTRMRFDDLQFTRGYFGWLAYGQSKLANIYFTLGLDGRMNGDRITANALHPGLVATNFGKNNGIFKPFFDLGMLIAVSAQEGAQTPIFLAASPEVEGVSGKYFVGCRTVMPSYLANDLNAARRLWDLSLEMTGLTQPG